MPVVVTVGLQWGDEGKGKFNDFLVEEADVVVRHQGGNNAGHTVIFDGKKIAVHLLPTGLLHPGKFSVIANGVVIDPSVLLDEMENVRAMGLDVSPTTLMISSAANVIMPYHRSLDVLREAWCGDKKHGTTGRGIGPAYMDKVGYRGIRMSDLTKPDVLRDKLELNLPERNAIITKVYGGEPFDLESVLEEYAGYGARLADYLGDASLEVNRRIDRKERILFEGAQGSGLDVDLGTYPFVTGSNTTAGGACTGCGIGPTRIDRVLGIAKAITSRVGEGPFPTEVFDEMANYLRNAGPAAEYGATTGRPRRCGWFDTVAVRANVRTNGVDCVAVTKLDVLDDLDKIPVGVAYELDGERIEEFPSDATVLKRVKPVFEELPGWKTKTSHIREYDALPQRAREFLEFIGSRIGAPVNLVGVGPDRAETIIFGENLFRERRSLGPSRTTPVGMG